MEKPRNFKPIVETNTKNISTTGKAQRQDQPVNESKLVTGLTAANSNGEAIIKKPIRTVANKTKTNPKGSGTKPKLRDTSFYPDHVFNPINNCVIVLVPNSKVKIEDYTDFIHATQDETRANDIVDILPPLYNVHFNIIQNVDTRFMVGDEVVVNFKYRSTVELTAIKQKETRIIKEIKVVNLKNMSAIVAYLDNNDFFPINELDHVRA